MRRLLPARIMIGCFFKGMVGLVVLKSCPIRPRRGFCNRL